jgi:hypothetical protein
MNHWPWTATEVEDGGVLVGLTKQYYSPKSISNTHATFSGDPLYQALDKSGGTENPPIFVQFNQL